MASSSNGGASLRKEIFDMIKQVHCKQNQNLRDVKLSEDVYRRSKNFTRTDTGHRHYYPALDRMEGGGVFGLLQEAAGNASLGDACDLVGRWKEAINSLLRYALNLLLAPNRPELKTVKLYNSYYVYQISDKLKGAEKVLFVLGYHPKQQTSSENFSTSSPQELVYKDEVNRDHVADVATDLVILGSDLDHLQEKIKECGSHGKNRWLSDVLKAWERDLKNIMIRSACLATSRDDGTGLVGDGRTERLFHSMDPEAGYRTDENLRMRGVGSGNVLVAGGGNNCNPHVNHWNYEAEITIHPQQEGMHHVHHNHNYNDKTGCDTSRANVSHNGSGTGAQLSRPLQYPSACPPHGSHSQREGYRYRHEERISTDTTSADEDSFTVMAQNIPRPNVDDLPEPVFGVEDDLKDDVHGAEDDYNSDLSLIINPRSDDVEDSLIGPQYYAFLPSSDAPTSTSEWNHRGADYSGAEVEVSPDQLQRPVNEVGHPLSGSSPVHQRRSPREVDALTRLRTPEIEATYEIIEMHHVEGFPSSPSHEPPSKVKPRPGGGKDSSIDKTEVSSSQHSSRHDGPNLHSMKKMSSLCEGEGEDGFTVVDVCENDDETCKNDHKSLKKSSPTETANGGSKEGHLLSDMWLCDFCTYINPMDVSVCGICGVNKYKKKT